MNKFDIKLQHMILPILFSPFLFIVSCIDVGFLSKYFSKEMMLLFYFLLFTLPAILFASYLEIIYTTIFTLFSSIVLIYIFYQKNQFFYFDDWGITYHTLVFTLFLFISHSIVFFLKRKTIRFF